MKKKLTYKERGLMPPSEKKKWRAKGYHIGFCWKCRRQTLYIQKHRMGKYGYKPICSSCRIRMGIT